MVEVVDVPDLMAAFEARIAEGYTFGDWQYLTDEHSENLLTRGIFPCYRRVPDNTPIAEGQLTIDVDGWREIVFLGHTDKTRCFEVYRDYYLASSGQVYWSDTHQLIPYDVDYHELLDARLCAEHPATEMITELFVPRDALADFMMRVRDDFRANQVNVVYGTVRLIERDEVTFLNWARGASAGVIFNLHLDHTPEALELGRATFRRLIDHAIAFGGGYFPTYHRWATRDQVNACFPQFPDFLRHKRRYDPDELFRSDWYEHHVRLLTPV